MKSILWAHANKNAQHSIKQLLYGMLLLSLSCWQFNADAQTIVPPSKIWLSLDRQFLSTINTQSSKEFWGLPATQQEESGLIAPAFVAGDCCYQSKVKPFDKGNPAAIKTGEQLVALLQAAREEKVPAYLLIDILAWQTKDLTSVGEKNGIFGVHPEWREISGGNALPQKPEAFFASPFNPEVRSILVQLVREVGQKFPLAAGIILNVRLSEREILGFSEAARVAAITDIGLDPIDLNLQNRADEQNTLLVHQWITWRRDQMTSLIREMRAAYLQAAPGKKVLVTGTADYYARQEFNDLRRTQDWRYWMQQGLVDGVLAEGHWQPRYTDDRYFADFLEEAAELSRTQGREILMVPVSRGKAAGDGGDYGRDWANLKTRIPTLDEMAFAVESEEDLQSAVAVASGKVALSRFQAPRVGEVLPEFFLTDGNGKRWEPREARGKNGLLLLIGDDAKALNENQALLERWKQAGVEPVVVSSRASSKSGLQSVRDEQRELVAWFPDGSGAVLVDRAGFTRSLGAVRNAAWPDFLKQPHELAAPIKEGEPAPDFALPDMNGHTLRLRDFKGKKNVLITFFPRCFTGGCKQHLASLQADEGILESNDLAIIAVSVDPPDLQRAFADSLGAHFPFIPDVGRNLSLLYGATENTTDLASRMSILIDKKGVVRWIEKNITVATHGADVLAKMRELGIS